MFIPIIIPVAQQGGREAIEARLREAGAVSPSSAIELETEEPADMPGLEEAIGLGRVMRASNGRLYLNEKAANAPREGIGFGLLLLLLAVGSVAASIAALILFAGS